MESKKEIVPLPESGESKKEQIAGMFDRVSGKYDLLNRILSIGIDKSWRVKAIKSLSTVNPQSILDVATGTGDFAITAHELLNPDSIIGIDISEGMLSEGAKKIVGKGLQNSIRLQYGDSENLLFPDNTFDAVMCAYGVRNFENLEKGLSEMARVMKPGGRVAILEFSKPQVVPFNHLYQFYFKNILPVIGKIISKDATAYAYLPASVDAFPDGMDFLKIMKRAGFNKLTAKPLSLGITTLYTATK